MAAMTRVASTKRHARKSITGMRATAAFTMTNVEPQTAVTATRRATGMAGRDLKG